MDQTKCWLKLWMCFVPFNSWNKYKCQSLKSNSIKLISISTYSSQPPPTAHSQRDWAIGTCMLQCVGLVAPRNWQRGREWSCKEIYWGITEVTQIRVARGSGWRFRWRGGGGREEVQERGSRWHQITFLLTTSYYFITVSKYSRMFCTSYCYNFMCPIKEHHYVIICCSWQSDHLMPMLLF